MKSERRLVAVLAGFLMGGEVTAVLFHLFNLPWHEPTYRAYHLAQMVLAIAVSILISFRIRSLGMDRNVSRVSILIPAGLILSLGGDIVNSGLADLPIAIKPRALLSIPFFAIAHILYIAAFYFVCRGSDGITRGRLIAGILVWLATAFGLWFRVIPSGAPGLVRCLSLFYALVVVGMAVSSWGVFFARGKAALLVPLGGALFAVSDGIIGMTMFSPGQVLVTVAVWTTYFAAQLMIMSLLFLLVPGGRK